MKRPCVSCMDNTLASVFLSSSEKFRDRVFLRWYEGSWKAMTYGEFRTLAEGVAARLARGGLEKGDRAAIVSENRPEWCAAYLAVVLCGGIAVPVDIQLGPGEIENLLVDSGAKAVFYSAKTGPNVSGALAGHKLTGINFDDPDRLTAKDASAFREVLPDDIASIIYTSGTTGRPKGVMLTHRNFCSDAEAVIRGRIVIENDNVLSILPFHHTYPFMTTFLVPLFLGVSVTFGPGLKAAEVVSAIKDNGVTVVVGVPRLFETIRNSIFSRIREKGRAGEIVIAAIRLSGKIRRAFGVNAGKALFRSVHRNFGPVRFFASGGARLDPSVMEDLEAIGFTVVEGYGLTETSPVVTFNPLHKRKPGSVGRPLPGVSLRTGGDGEVIVKGPMVMKGYYKDPVATAEVIRDGELYTGDIGSIDGDGYLFITGRKKEVIVLSSGKNIYPEDVEKAYMVSPLIKEMCVLPAENADSLRAVIVPDLDYARQESIGNISEALGWKISEVSARLPEYMRIRGYVLRPRPLPRTPLGKLRRFMVSGMLERQKRPGRAVRQAPREREEQPDSLLIGDETGRKVVEAIKALAGEEGAVRSADNLELDLGFDSLGKVELVSALERTFSLRLPDAFIAGVHTVGDVVSALKKYRSGEGAAAEAGALSWKELLEKGLSPEDAGEAVRAQGSAETAFVYGVLMLVKAFFRVVCRLEIEGARHIPEKGPFVIAPNHASYLDGFIIAVSVPFRVFRDLYFLGLKQFFTGGLKAWFARLAHVIPIDSETYLHKALQMSASVLKDRRSLCVFPEGGRSFDGSILPFKKGIGVLALELGIPVIPAALTGTNRALPRGAKLIRPAKIRVVFGEPVRPEGINEGIDRYQRFADGLRQKVIQLSKS